MKITIMYYYNLENITILKQRDRVHVFSKREKYQLIPIKSKEEVTEIYNLLKKYNLENKFYKFVLTKENSLTMEYFGVKYVLLKIDNEKCKIEESLINQMVVDDAQYILDRSDWKDLWCKKNNNIEKIKIDIVNKKEIVRQSIDYYIGMAECAISYYSYIATQTASKKTLSYKKIDPKEMRNPLNIIIDTPERNICEYLKYLFIHEQNNNEVVNKILFEQKEYQINYEKIIARLLYPNYYFNLIETMNDKEKEDEIIKIINRINEYEDYIRKIYKLINAKIKIKKIDWI